jgi:hypothetical protein
MAKLRPRFVAVNSPLAIARRMVRSLTPRLAAASVAEKRPSRPIASAAGCSEAALLESIAVLSGMASFASSRPNSSAKRSRHRDPPNHFHTFRLVRAAASTPRPRVVTRMRRAFAALEAKLALADR